MSPVQRLTVAAIAICGASAFAIRLGAQQPVKTIESPTANLVLAKPGTRFEFDAIEMFDAKYAGDTAGYIGKSGGLAGIRPHVALGDPVFGAIRESGRSRTWSGRGRRTD